MGNDNLVVTREQVKDLIKSEGLKPSDLFDADSLGSDPIVRGYADGLVRERIGRAWREKEEAKEELEKLRKEVGPKEAVLQEQIKALKANAAKSQIGPLLEKQKGERKLGDRQMKFIQSRLPRFAPQNPDEIEKEFTTFLDGEIDEYGRIAKDVFGIEQKPEPGKDPVPGGEPRKGTETPGVDKYLDPAQNPFIKIKPS